jgi:cell division protease FtsH
VGIIKKYDLRDQDTLERVAIHELGHTIPILTFPEYFDFDKVTIQSTYKGAGGYTIFREKENITESGMYTKDFLKKKLMIQLGGKAAETLFYGREKVSLGAFQDLKQANSLAKQMIQDFGMGNKLEIFAGIESQPSQYILASIDKEVLNILNEAYHDVFNLLVNNKDLINNIKNDLIDKKTLNASFFKQ